MVDFPWCLLFCGGNLLKTRSAPASVSSASASLAESMKRLDSDEIERRTVKRVQKKAGQLHFSHQGSRNIAPTMTAEKTNRMMVGISVAPSPSVKPRRDDGGDHPAGTERGNEGGEEDHAFIASTTAAMRTVIRATAPTRAKKAKTISIKPRISFGGWVQRTQPKRSRSPPPLHAGNRERYEGLWCLDAPARDCPVAPPGVTTARRHPFSVFRIGTLFDGQGRSLTTAARTRG
jgi:hypothetical protein